MDRPRVKNSEQRSRLSPRYFELDKRPQAVGHTSALHAASLRGYLGIAELLLRYEADVSIYDERGRTPLHYAPRSGSADIAKLLLLHNTNSSTSDEDGQTPLHFAIENSELTHILATSGANLLAEDHSSLTPIHWAIGLGYIQAFKVLIDCASARKLDHIVVNSKGLDG